RCDPLRTGPVRGQQQRLPGHARLHGAVGVRAVRKDDVLGAAVGQPARRRAVHRLSALQRRYVQLRRPERALGEPEQLAVPVLMDGVLRMTGGGGNSMTYLRVIGAGMLLLASAGAYADPCKLAIDSNDMMQFSAHELAVPTSCTDVEVT